MWIQQPRHKEDVIDLLNTRIYKAFAAAGLEIPYSKHDVYIKDMPAMRPALTAEAPQPPAPPAAPATALAAATQVAHVLAQNGPSLSGPQRRFTSGTPG